MTGNGRLLLEAEVPYCTGSAWELKHGQHIRITARHIVDFVAFNLHNLKERLDQARTKVNQAKVYVTKGDVLYSKDNNVMLSIVDDTWKYRHDMQFGTCSRKRFELIFQGKAKLDIWGEVPGSLPPRSLWEEIPPRGCWENLEAALKPWGISRWDIPSPLNIFQDVKIDGRTGHMGLVLHDEEAAIEMRAEMDLLVAGANDLDGKAPFSVQIYEGWLK